MSSEANEKLILALPKGRIFKEAAPLFARVGIEPEAAFADPDARQLRFTTNHADLDIIRVRSFDVATFVAFGAAHLGIAGADVLMEFDYPEIYAPIDLGIGKCRLAVAEPVEMAGSDDPRRWSHVRIATKYPEVTRRHFAARGVQAECVKLSGAMELAPSLGLSHRIVDLVDSGRTLKENGLVEIEHIADITSRFIVNRAALKTQPGADRPAGSIASARSAVPPERLDASAPGFEKEFSAFLGRNRDTDENVDRIAADIVADVRARGDAALVEYTRKFDKVDTDAAGLRISDAERKAAAAKVPAAQREALAFAAQRIEAFHRALAAEGRRLHRRHRHAARRPLPAARIGRRLRAGRHGGLSVLGADEHRAGQGGGRRRASSWSCRRRTASSIRWSCWRPRSPAPTRSGASAARRRWRRWPTARNRSSRSTRSPARATPMSPPPSAASSARSAST